MVDARRIDGRTVTFRHERGSAPSLICVHGSAGNHHAYDRLLDALPGRDRYAINLPGRAGTDGPALGTAAEMQSFLSRFIESEVKGDYVVVGHSLGGGVAIEHALSPHSARLQGLVLLATGARLRVLPTILQFFDQGAKNGVRPSLPPAFFEPGADRALVDEAIMAFELTPIETGAADWRAADRFDRMQELEDIGVPTLIVAGSKDTLTPPKYAEYLAAKISEAQLRIIEGASHMLVMERTAELARWIERFLRDAKSPL